MLELLLDGGSDSHVATAQGWSAFHYTCLQGKAECAAALIRAGCDVDQRVKAGRAGDSDRAWVTAKELAAARGHTDTVAVCESVVSDAKAEERAARAKRDARAKMASQKAERFGAGLKPAAANSLRCSTADQLATGFDHLQPMADDELSGALLNKRLRENALESATRPHYPDGQGSCAVVFAKLPAAAATELAKAQAEVIEAVEASAGWLASKPGTFHVPILLCWPWDYEASAEAAAKAAAERSDVDRALALLEAAKLDDYSGIKGSKKRIAELQNLYDKELFEAKTADKTAAEEQAEDDAEVTMLNRTAPSDSVHFRCQQRGALLIVVAVHRCPRCNGCRLSGLLLQSSQLRSACDHIDLCVSLAPARQVWDPTATASLTIPQPQQESN